MFGTCRPASIAVVTRDEVGQRQRFVAGVALLEAALVEPITLFALGLGYPSHVLPHFVVITTL
jgi:hypothetical protein